MGDFELFTDYGASSRQTLTLRSSGYLFISNSICKKFDGNLERAEIHIDKSNMIVGISESKQGKKTLKEKSGRCINLFPLIRSLNITTPDSKEFIDITWKSEMMVFSLDYIKHDSIDD